MIFVPDDDGEVDARRANPFDKSSVPFNMKLDLHARIERRKVRQDRRQNPCKVLRASDAYMAGEVRPLPGVQQLVVQHENAARIGEGNLSRFGQSETTSALAEYRYAEILLQALHLQTDG